MKRKQSIGKRSYDTLKSWHKYLGIALSLFLIWMSLSGIILNHPDWFAHYSVPKALIPEDYHPQNWNREGVKDALFIGKDTIYFGGKHGLWISTDNGYTFEKENSKGFTTAPYYQKINDLLWLEKENKILAATYGGLWIKNLTTHEWHQVDLGKYSNAQFVKVLRRKDELIAFSQSGVYTTTIANPEKFIPRTLLRAERPYMDLIQFTFALHSGWLWGLPGRLVYDIVAVILVFLSITALYITLRKNFKKSGSCRRSKKRLGWMIRNHTRIGFWSLGILLIIGGTGMFMRPPLLVALANGKVPTKYIPSPILQNPWYHTLRNAVYDPAKDRIILDTTEGLFEGKGDLSSPFTTLEWDVNIFVMGATVMEHLKGDEFMIGSFYGLYHYKEGDPNAYDIIMNDTVPLYTSVGRPGLYMIGGDFQTPEGDHYISAYGQGLLPFKQVDPNRFQQPHTLRDSYRMPLWNYMFELHNARLFRPILDKWVIIVIPLTGLLFLVLNISGAYEYLYRKWKK
ncbi:PepSY-associated TM helix domain-containing protein [Algivirga pacifica]